jgi:hypothetical protein
MMPVIADDAYMLGSPEDIAAVYPGYKANLKDRRLDQRGQKRIAALLGATVATVPCELPSDFPMNLKTRRGAIY